MKANTLSAEKLNFSTKLAFGAGDLGPALCANILIFYLLFFYTLIVLSFIDISLRVIPNKIMLFLIISGILLNFVLKIITWPQALTGTIVAGVIIYLVRILGQFIFKKESMGIVLEHSWNENNSPVIILIIDLFLLLPFDKRGRWSGIKPAI